MTKILSGYNEKGAKFNIVIAKAEEVEEEVAEKYAYELKILFDG